PVSVASFFFCFLSSTVWTISETGRVTLDDENQLEVFILPLCFYQKLPGMCWGCKWMLKKVKAALGNTTKVEKIKSQLSKVCDKIGLLRSQCKKFVAKNVDVLTEELTTTDDVRTICVNVRACRPKELLDLTPLNEEPFMEVNSIP
uniref:Saposin B-type domain-containing protein n=1 Tax=Oryzias sinensis TaxID=183150 RepID=A0A8C7Z649_9TELE